MSDTATGDDELMTIGAFARQTRLSLKALRLYDELRLLPPASVDDSNGYRYYHAQQVERARLIGLLRRLDPRPPRTRDEQWRGRGCEGRRT